MGEPSRGHSKFNPDAHEHLATGVALSNIQRAVHVFRLRPGRVFTSADIYRHRQALKAWTWRYWGRKASPDHTSIPVVESVLILHMKEDNGNESLCLSYEVWTDVPAEARCLVAQFALGGDDSPSPMDLVAGLISQQRAAAQYSKESDGRLN